MTGCSRRTFLGAAGATPALMAVGAGTLARAATKPKRLGPDGRQPNIVYVILDELGYFEFSCMGNKHLKTPNIDRMAAEGIRFTDALAGGPVCAPTRSVLLTGKHLGHTTVRANSGFTPLRVEDITIGEVMSAAGYVCGGFGKWGVGGRGTSGVPEKHGFKEFFGYYDQVHAHTYYPPYLIHNSEEVPLKGNTGDLYVGETFSHTVIVDHAKAFIREHKDEPFLCYCPWTPPHGLWGFPEDEPSWQLFKDKPWTAGQRLPTDAKVYAAMVHMIDRQIGELIALVKELGLDDNTLFIVTGDNGGQDYFWKDPRENTKKADAPYPHGFFGPNLNPATGERFRGGKGALYEGGLRVPAFARWTSTIAPGQVSDHLWYFADFMPTFAELGGAVCPDDSDGISFVPTLLGEKAAGRKQKRHEYMYWEAGARRAVRIENWKGHLGGKDKKWELYDLATDVEELVNVADKHTDIVAKMAAYAEEAHVENILGVIYDRELVEKDRKAKKG